MRLFEDEDEGRFRGICENALEGGAAMELNLETPVERLARAKEQRLVPESIARFTRVQEEEPSYGTPENDR